MKLRNYQSEAITAVEKYLETDTGNPLVVSATGTGKTVIFCTMMSQWLANWPTTRILVLAHQKELLIQAAEKLASVNPHIKHGFYCSGISQRKDATQSVTFASIQTIYKKATDLDPFDIVIVDEAHLIPVKGFGQYRHFLNEATLVNPWLRVIGFTATPYRLNGGSIVDPLSQDHIFDFKVYETKIRDMIDQGYLCPLTSKATETRIDTSKLHLRGGEYIDHELAEVADTEALVNAAVNELHKRASDRHSILIFCCGVDHALHVRDAIRRYGIECETVSGQTAKEDRKKIIQRFGDPTRKTPMAVTNMNVLTTGLDVTRIDCIAMLRPTKSPSLYVQMVGRGFRLDPLKANTLVLDFAGNVTEHGPVDLVDAPKRKSGKPGKAVTKTCPECDEIVAGSTRLCPECGYEFEFEQQAPHSMTPSDESILSDNGVRTWTDPHISVNRHRKQGKPDSIRVTYRSGLATVSEYVCLDHPGYAGAKARAWWRRRFGDPIPSVTDALSNMFLPQQIQNVTESVSFRKNGKYQEITSHSLKSTEAQNAQLVS